MLQTLNAAGWNHAIISNHVLELPGLVAAMGLAPFFERIFCSAQHGVEKPQPDFLERLLAAPGRCDTVWAIGDSVRADITGARSARLPSILIGPRHVSADGCAASINEVPSVVMGRRHQGGYNYMI